MAKRAQARIIAVAKSGEFLHRFESLFPRKGIEVHAERSLDHVIESLEKQPYDVLLITSTAFKAGGVDGLELLDLVAATSPQTQVLFLASQADIQTVVSVLKRGVYQYATFPVQDEELRLLVEAAVETSRQHPLRPTSRGEEVATEPLGKIVGRSDQMREVFRLIRQAAATDIPVLLTGETGSGKDLVAQAIHWQSQRSSGPYVPVNLGALPPDLVPSELFGHEKGAFTGAHGLRKGKFELAREGTVFLDEIGTIDEKVQIALLRLIEERRFHRLGGCKSIASDARIIAATNANLSEAMERGTFREDLFFRLDVFRIDVPPLRERPNDISLLVDEFLVRYNGLFGKNVRGITPQCMSLLESYAWPGNVRELKNVIQRGVLLATDEVLSPDHLPAKLRPGRRAPTKVSFDIGTPLVEVEREMIVKALEVTQNNRKRAAALLGISRRALYNKFHKHGIV
ncbi:MAG TPA: sigma-54 dependent transcriptional regulator [Sumerlaeia bacterium]|nr:sigma-54 dependent transcriptional regulator [Sumerlaeia bacterium]